MRLDQTYESPEIHDTWKGVYRSSPSQQRFEDEVYDWLIRELQPTGRWLDAGCGTGDHTLRLARRGLSVTAVDISSSALAAARQAVAASGKGERIQFVQSALEDLVVSPACENVHCRGVLMHIPDWRSALDHLKGHVGSNGRFVIFEGNNGSFSNVLVRTLRRFVRTKSQEEVTDSGTEYWDRSGEKPFLIRAFDHDVLVRELERHGFSLEFRRSLFLIDLNRSPAMLRGLCRAINRLWFRMNGPFADGVVFVFSRNNAGRRQRNSQAA